MRVERSLLEANNREAARLRAQLEEAEILALNLVSSPGAGKTTLLVRTVERLAKEIETGVIEGDQQTSRDADRIRQAGANAVQINTGKGCHLEAPSVAHGLAELALPPGSVLFVENVGNLVCPALFDLGERHKVVVLSVAEGDDKPLKYPHMFRAADLMIVNKIDLLPFVDFDLEACLENARQVHPGIEMIALSATTGEGLEGWLEWVSSARRRSRASERSGAPPA
jgi:hydrogenase nickel incorporation protein HypB